MCVREAKKKKEREKIRNKTSKRIERRLFHQL